jgi:hypothetical protein
VVVEDVMMKVHNVVRRMMDRMVEMTVRHMSAMVVVMHHMVDMMNRMVERMVDRVMSHRMMDMVRHVVVTMSVMMVNRHMVGHNVDVASKHTNVMVGHMMHNDVMSSSVVDMVDHLTRMMSMMGGMVMNSVTMHDMTSVMLRNLVRQMHTSVLQMMGHLTVSVLQHSDGTVSMSQLSLVQAQGLLQLVDQRMDRLVLDAARVVAGMLHSLDHLLQNVTLVQLLHSMTSRQMRVMLLDQMHQLVHMANLLQNVLNLTHVVLTAVMVAATLQMLNGVMQLLLQLVMNRLHRLDEMVGVLLNQMTMVLQQVLDVRHSLVVLQQLVMGLKLLDDASDPLHGILASLPVASSLHQMVGLGAALASSRTTTARLAELLGLVTQMAVVSASLVQRARNLAVNRVVTVHAMTMSLLLSQMALQLAMVASQLLRHVTQHFRLLALALLHLLVVRMRALAGSQDAGMAAVVLLQMSEVPAGTAHAVAVHQSQNAVGMSGGALHISLSTLGSLLVHLSQSHALRLASLSLSVRNASQSGGHGLAAKLFHGRVHTASAMVNGRLARAGQQHAESTLFVRDSFTLSSGNLGRRLAQTQAAAITLKLSLVSRLTSLHRMSVSLVDTQASQGL